MMARKDEVKELQGAANSLRGFLQVFRHANELTGKIDAALSADVRLTQWEKEESDLKTRIAGLHEELLVVKQAVTETRDTLSRMQAQAEVARNNLARAEADLADKIRAQDAALEEDRERHEAVRASFAQERAAAEEELRKLRADAQKIREHFAGAPA